MAENGERSAKQDNTKWQGLFQDSLYKVCQEVHPRVGIKEDALAKIEELILQILSDICTGQPHSVADVEKLVQSNFPEPINGWAIKDAQEALLRLVRKQKDKDKSIFPVQKLQSALKEMLGYKVDLQVAHYISAVLEYIAADILTLTGNYVKNIQHSEITCQDLLVAMHADRFLMDLFYHDDDYDSAAPVSLGSSGNDVSSCRVGSLNCEQVVRHIVHEESQHLRDLELIIHVFRKPLLELLPGSKEIDVIFSNILDVHDFTVRFLGLFEDTIEMSRDSANTTIGTCFLEMAEGQEFEVYDKYTMDIASPSCFETLNAVVQRKSVARELDSKGKGFRLAVRYVLPKLLLGPVFHFFQYYEDIEMLMKLTQCQDDCMDLHNSKDIITFLNSKLEHRCFFLQRRKYSPNFSLRAGTQQNAKLSELQKYVDGLDISGSDCQFIMEGTLKIVNSVAPKIMSNAVLGVTDTLRGRTKRTAERMERFVFLFSTQIFLCKPYQSRRKGAGGGGGSSTPELRLKERFHIRKLQVVDRDDTEEMKNAFELHPGDHQPRDDTEEMKNASELYPRDQPPIILLARTAEEKRDWMAALVTLQTRSMLERMLDAEKKRYPLLLPSPDSYRFAEKDTDENIIFEDYTSSSGIPVVKGATRIKLVERVTYHTYADPKFVRTFMTTFRAFLSPKDLLRLLIERFNIPDSFNLSETGGIGVMDPMDSSTDRESLKRFRKEYVQPVQFRVLNVIRHWIDHHWHDFEQEPELQQILLGFLAEISSHNNAVQKWVLSIERNVKKKIENPMPEPKIVTHAADAPPVEYHLVDQTSLMEYYDLMTLHPTEIARQVTLLEFELYRAVKPIELVGAAWTKKDKDQKSPQLLKLIRHSTNFTYWLEKCIVEAMNYEERIAVVNRILEIMCVFQELNNFTGLIEIYGVMESSAVHRLDRTKEKVDPKLWKEFLKVKELFSDAHHRHYHERLRSINPPCVPFFGMYLSNIIFLEEGNQTFLRISGAMSADSDDLRDDDERRIISFTKCRKIADVIGEIYMYQNQPYNLTTEDNMKLFFENLNPLGDITDKQAFETYLWNKSIEIEPKDCEKLPDFPASRKYSLKTPGIKPHRTAGQAKRTLGPGTSVPPTPQLTPIPELGKDRFVLPPVGEQGGECDKSIIKIGQGKPPQFIADVPNQSWFSLMSVSSHQIMPAPIPALRQPSGARDHNKPPPLPPRHAGFNNSSTNIVASSGGVNDLSPPLPPKPVSKREGTPVSAGPTSSSSNNGDQWTTHAQSVTAPVAQPIKFDFSGVSAFDPLCSSSAVADQSCQQPQASPVWPAEPLSRPHPTPTVNGGGSTTTGVPPVLPPRRIPPPPTGGGNGNASPRSRDASESSLPQQNQLLDDPCSFSRQSLASAAATIVPLAMAPSSSSTPSPPPLPPRRATQSPSVPPPRPPPRRSAVPEPPPALPPKTFQRRLAPAPRRSGNVTTPVGCGLLQQTNNNC